MEEYDHNDKISQLRTWTTMQQLHKTQAWGNFLPLLPQFGDCPGVPSRPSQFREVLPQHFCLIRLYLQDPCPNAHQDCICPAYAYSTGTFTLCSIWPVLAHSSKFAARAAGGAHLIVQHMHMHSWILSYRSYYV